MYKKLLIIFTLSIILLAVLPINRPDSEMNHKYFLSIRLDYLAHFAIFIPWMALVWLHTGAKFNSSPLKASSWILAGIALALFTELIQYFLPYRAFNLNDLAANMMGVLLGSNFFFFKRPARLEDGE